MNLYSKKKTNPKIQNQSNQKEFYLLSSVRPDQEGKLQEYSSSNVNNKHDKEREFPKSWWLGINPVKSPHTSSPSERIAQEGMDMSQIAGPYR